MNGFPPRSSERRKTISVNDHHPIVTEQKQQQDPLPSIHSNPTINVFRSILTEIDTSKCEENGENAFYVCDLAYVYRQYLRWQEALGNRVEPFFAVKCNPDSLVLKLLAQLGTGFDCASHAEIEMVLKLGVEPSRIIYANPCKAGSFVRHAHAKGVQMMTFDNQDELEKVAKFHPNARMVLRILTDDSGSLCRLGEKFGAPLENVRGLLERAKELDVAVIGVAFHVGSGCSNPLLYTDAVGRAKWTFELGQELGFHFDFLDVGGGFGDDNFDLLAEGLLAGLDKYFPVGCGVRVIAEPGRYFVTRAFELATNIIARRKAPTPPPSSLVAVRADEQADDLASKDQQDSPVTMYYINDGVYGAFNCIIFDHQVVEPKVLTLGGVFYGDGFTETGYPSGPMTPCLSEHEMDCSTDSVGSLSVTSALFERPIGRLESSGSASSAFLVDELELCKIFGPSCDSIDLVSPATLLPTNRLLVGDWLRWPNMGAYTICAASQFNGFKISQVVYTIGDPSVDEKVRHILRSSSSSAL
ncbi:hypothetical protein PGT21_024456 [Puccinia graminis f. sp. tritici]|uniref:ornithine decarboxylase n=1 Tax=Puccinia graminis f. sp. tritici TaxID=56615 RepID=A0A5B0P9R9_PUCGR|nr:hypothetical protein PGT21_024456 [Puccinia graminis f. sp. tritici]KAA1131761.1 hypothetical protein PGTUg99_021237 [Puccinia graminis f. sp. tritici]